MILTEVIEFCIKNKLFIYKDNLDAKVVSTEMLDHVDGSDFIKVTSMDAAKSDFSISVRYVDETAKGHYQYSSKGKIYIKTVSKKITYDNTDVVCQIIVLLSDKDQDKLMESIGAKMIYPMIYEIPIDSKCNPTASLDDILVNLARLAVTRDFLTVSSRKCDVRMGKIPIKKLTGPRTPFSNDDKKKDYFELIDIDTPKMPTALQLYEGTGIGVYQDYYNSIGPEVVLDKVNITKKINQLTLRINLLRYYLMRSPYFDQLDKGYLVIVKAHNTYLEVTIQRKLHYRTIKD